MKDEDSTDSKVDDLLRVVEDIRKWQISEVYILFLKYCNSGSWKNEIKNLKVMLKKDIVSTYKNIFKLSHT